MAAEGGRRRWAWQELAQQLEEASAEDRLVREAKALFAKDRPELERQTTSHREKITTGRFGRFRPLGGPRRAPGPSKKRPRG